MCSVRLSLLSVTDEILMEEEVEEVEDSIKGIDRLGSIQGTGVGHCVCPQIVDEVISFFEHRRGIESEESLV